MVYFPRENRFHVPYFVDYFPDSPHPPGSLYISGPKDRSFRHSWCSKFYVETGDRPSVPM